MMGNPDFGRTNKLENKPAEEIGSQIKREEILSNLKTNVIDFSGSAGCYAAKEMHLKLNNKTIGELVFMQNDPDYGTLRISEIFLRDGYHGLGIGMKFYEDLIAYARENHFKKIASGFSVKGGALVAWIKLAEKYKVLVNPKVINIEHGNIDFNEIVQMYKDKQLPKDYTLHVKMTERTESVFELIIENNLISE